LQRVGETNRAQVKKEELLVVEAMVNLFVKTEVLANLKKDVVVGQKPKNPSRNLNDLLNDPNLTGCVAK
jgi:hypothetical protein